MLLHAGLVGRVEEPGGLFIEVELAAAAAEEIAQVMPITGREISVAGSVLALVIGFGILQGSMPVPIPRGSRGTPLAQRPG